MKVILTKLFAVFATFAMSLAWGLLISGCDGSSALPDAGGTDIEDGSDTGEQQDVLPDGDSGSGEDTTPETDTGDDPDTDTTTPTGDGTLAFTVVWGSNAGKQYVGNAWFSFIELNVLKPSTAAYRDHRVVAMLCELSDPMCESPSWIHEVTEDEWDSAPIQNGFGPEVTLTGIPEGKRLFMAFVDSGMSRVKGYGWQDDFEQPNAHWGGVVSEFDVLLSGTNPIATGVQPAPQPIEVVVSNEAQDLGKLTFNHIYDRDIGGTLPTETGEVAIAVPAGLQILDLASWSLLPAAGFPGTTYAMLTPELNPRPGNICGMAQAPDETVWLLMDSGQAVHFDVRARAQSSGYHSVIFEGGAPCRGWVVDLNGERWLLATNASASRLAESEGAASEGLWAARIDNIAETDVVAVYSDRKVNDILRHGVSDLIEHEDTLYLSISVPPTDKNAPVECLGAHCIFKGALAKAGTLQLGEFRRALEQNDGAPIGDPAGSVSCTTADPWAAISKAQFHDGRWLLFVGGCTQIAAIDLSTFALVDFDANLLGVQNLSGTLYGQGFKSFALAPNGKTLWALPQEKTPVHFYVEKGHEDTEGRQTFNRFMAFPIALHIGAQPGLDPLVGAGDIDGHEGLTNIGPLRTPAGDPGIDINHASYVVYQLYWLPSTAGFTFQGAAFPVGPSVLVLNNSLLVRGSGATGQSGLGKGGALGVYDLNTRRAVLVPQGSVPYYPFWTGSPQEAGGFFGIDLDPTSPQDTPTRGFVFLP